MIMNALRECLMMSAAVQTILCRKTHPIAIPLWLCSLLVVRTVWVADSAADERCKQQDDRGCLHLDFNCKLFDHPLNNWPTCVGVSVC